MTILGECPYDGCNNFHAYEAELFVYTKHKCEKCGRLFWIHHNPLDPVAITDEEFNKRYIIKGNKIERRGKTDD